MNTEENDIKDFQLYKTPDIYDRQYLGTLGPMTLHEAVCYSLLPIEELQELLKEGRIQHRETTKNGKKQIIIHRQAIDDYMMGQTNVTRHLTIINDTLKNIVKQLNDITLS